VGTRSATARRTFASVRSMRELYDGNEGVLERMGILAR